MRAVAIAVVLAAAGCASRPGGASVEQVLDDFHAAAADADFGRYFGHFARDAVFLGTDPGERWERDEFEAFVRPYFEGGQGWTYVPGERHVVVRDGVAWFDELLENESYGTCRGSGVLVFEDRAWRIAQYNLALTVPNERAREVVELIRSTPGPGGR